MAKIEKKWAESLLKIILNLNGDKKVVLSTENDTSTFTISGDGNVGTSPWSKELFLALVEKGVHTEGSLLIRCHTKKGSVLYGVILGRGGVVSLSVVRLGQLFFKTYGKASDNEVILGQLKIDLIS